MLLGLCENFVKIQHGKQHHLSIEDFVLTSVNEKRGFFLKLMGN
jgi:hypothetical protein